MVNPIDDRCTAAVAAGFRVSEGAREWVHAVGSRRQTAPDFGSRLSGTITLPGGMATQGPIAVVK